MIQTYNYATHAIEDIKEKLKEFQKRNIYLDHDRKISHNIINALKEGQKFILPENAEMVNMEGLDNETLKTIRMPYPIMVLEAPYSKDLLENDYMKTVESKKRLALVIEHTHINQIIRDMPENEPGAYIINIDYIPDENQRYSWHISVVGRFHPYSSTTFERDSTDVLDKIYANEKNLKRTKQFRGGPFVVLPDAMNVVMQESTVQEIYEHTLFNSQDEFSMFLQTCCVLNCSNIEMISTKDNKYLNKTRELKGKTPFFQYNVLQVSKKSYESNSTGIEKTSPRSHLRRGHIRRYSDGKQIWVKPSVINPGVGQAIKKDYDLRKV